MFSVQNILDLNLFLRVPVKQQGSQRGGGGAGGAPIPRDIYERIIRIIYKALFMVDENGNRIYKDKQIKARILKIVNFYWPGISDAEKNRRVDYYFDEVYGAFSDFENRVSQRDQQINKRRISQEDKNKLKTNARKELAGDFLHQEASEYVNLAEQMKKRTEEREEKFKQLVEMKKKEGKQEKEFKEEKSKRAKPGGWISVPPLRSGVADKLLKPIISIVAGLAVSAIFGNPFFFLGFLLFGFHFAIPGPLDVAGVQNRLGMLKKKFDKEIGKASTDAKRNQILKRMENETNIWKILGEMNMRTTVGGGAIIKEILKVSGSLVFVLAFVTSSIPISKPLGLIIGFVLYFMINYEKKPPIEGEEKGWKAIKNTWLGKKLKLR